MALNKPVSMTCVDQGTFVLIILKILPALVAGKSICKEFVLGL
jgi:hypothetical protein